jgi:hypothetical protein
MPVLPNTADSVTSAAADCPDSYSSEDAEVEDFSAAQGVVSRLSTRDLRVLCRMFYVEYQFNVSHRCARKPGVRPVCRSNGESRAD